MYDGYAERIYNWLRETFFPYYQEQIGEILSNLSDIVSLLRNGLYLGVFVLLLWVAYTWLRPHLMKV